MPENKEVRTLELCDIAPFVPFGLEAQIDHCGSHKGLVNGLFYNHNSESCSVRAITLFSEDRVPLTKIKPYLRPLDQLTQEITHGQETFIMMDRLFELEWPSKPRENSPYYYNDVPNFINVHHHNSAANTKILKNQMFNNPYWMIRELLKYHFDVFDLIPSGLAIPIHNTK